jgi:ERCC4-type nuclease
LHRLAYREQTEEKRVVQIRKVDRRMPVHEQQMFLLTGFPQIGTTLAQDLLTCFDTPYRVIEEITRAEVRVSASGKTKRLESPLTNVKGIGPVIIENAQRLLKESFNANWMAYEEP